MNDLLDAKLCRETRAIARLDCDRLMLLSALSQSFIESYVESSALVNDFVDLFLVLNFFQVVTFESSKT